MKVLSMKARVSTKELDRAMKAMFEATEATAIDLNEAINRMNEACRALKNAQRERALARRAKSIKRAIKRSSSPGATAHVLHELYAFAAQEAEHGLEAVARLRRAEDGTPLFVISTRQPSAFDANVPFDHVIGVVRWPTSKEAWRQEARHGGLSA